MHCRLWGDVKKGQFTFKWGVGALSYVGGMKTFPSSVVCCACQVFSIHTAQKTLFVRQLLQLQGEWYHCDCVHVGLQCHYLWPLTFIKMVLGTYLTLLTLLYCRKFRIFLDGKVWQKFKSQVLFADVLRSEPTSFGCAARLSGFG